MPRIPTARRRRLPTGRVGGVVQPLSTADTGQDIEARGLGALGQGLGQLGQALQQIEVAEGTSQFATARGQSYAAMRDLELALQNNQDPSSYQKEFDRAFGNLQEFMPKNSIGAKKFDDWLQSREDIWAVGVDALAMRKTQSIAEGAYITNSATAIASGNLSEINTLIDEAEQTGVITSEQAAKDRVRAENKIIQIQQEGAKNAVFKAALTLPLDEGIDFINNSGLPLDDIKSVRTEYSTQKSIEAKQAEEALVEQQELERAQVYDKIEDRTITRDFVESMNSLSEGEQQTLWEKAAKSLDSDPAVYIPTIQNLMADTDSMTEPELSDLVGKGLSIENYKEAVKIKKGDSPLNKPRAKLHFDMLGNLFKNGTLTPLEYDQMHEDMTNYFNANPDATSIQANEFYHELTDDKQRGVAERLLSWWWNGVKKNTIAPIMKLKDTIFAPPSNEPDTEAEFEEMIRILNEHDPDSVQEYYDTWKHKW
jgi:hypothetical protein